VDGGETVRVRRTTVRLTFRGVARAVERLARLAGADLVDFVLDVRRVAVFVALRPDLDDLRDVVELLRLVLLRLDERLERERELDFLERPLLERPLLERPRRANFSASL
jgi:hypothetical protein